MSYAAKVLADSIRDGVRLTTMEVQFPRFILAEFNTHRMLSRNSASSRAIPVERRIEQVRTNPFVPEAFGKNKSGMQSSEALDEKQNALAREMWLAASRSAADMAALLALVEVHKQHANRVIETYAWHTTVVSSTEWANFFALRDHKAAQPEMQITARLMREAMAASTPKKLDVGEWHLPYVEESDLEAISALPDIDKNTLTKIALATSVARCAATSFERQHVVKPFDEYVKRHDGLSVSGHWSPFEHQAQATRLDKLTAEGDDRFVGNFRAPWVQYRKTFQGESIFKG